MYDLPENTWLEWKRKRRNTLTGFVIIGIAVGIDSSVVFSTLYLYLREIVKTDRPQMWYGLIVAFFFMSSSVFGAFSGRWLDRTRRVRAYVNFSLFVQIVGFLLYTISYHPVILLVGRTICGVGDPFTNVISGEIFRIYDKEGSTRALLWLSSIYSFGFIIGPSLNFAFIGIEFKIGSIVISHLNFIGIFMFVLLFIVIIIVNFLVHDCSMEFDLKHHLQSTSNTINIPGETSNDHTGKKIDTTVAGGNSSRITSTITIENDFSFEINRSTETTSLLPTPSFEINRSGNYQPCTYTIIRQQQPCITIIRNKQKYKLLAYLQSFENKQKYGNLALYLHHHSK